MASNSAPHRSTATRSAARAHLLALREARLEKRQKARSGRPVPPPPEGASLLDNDAFYNVGNIPSPTLAPDDLGIPEMPEVPDVTDMPDVITVPDVPDITDVSDIITPNDLPQDLDTADDDIIIPAHESEPLTLNCEADTAIPATPPQAEEPSAPIASALTTLPGTGPGLVWMLNNAGVLSLEDLACADAGDLSKKLGLIGEILDLDYWIDEAKRQTT
jgi:predicted flap endonuclease-1-like 5' DNA nuclease